MTEPRTIHCPWCLFTSGSPTGIFKHKEETHPAEHAAEIAARPPSQRPKRAQAAAPAVVPAPAVEAPDGFPDFVTGDPGLDGRIAVAILTVRGVFGSILAARDAADAAVEPLRQENRRLKAELADKARELKELQALAGPFLRAAERAASKLARKDGPDAPVA